MVGACSSVAESGPADPAGAGPSGTTSDPVEPDGSSDDHADPDDADPDDDVSTTTTAATTTAVTTTTEPSLDVYEPDCVVEVAAGESLSLIADRFDDDTVYPASIRAENDLGDGAIHPRQLLDVCVDNGINDITGDERTARNEAIVEAATREAVEAQQRHLNTLFDGYGTPPLRIDGDSGPVTRQRLCAARVALGLPVSTDHMEPGSDEEAELLAATELPVPFTTAILSERWILIDLTCQIMFVGESDEEIAFVFPTSTGEPGHETRAQDRTQAFRYDPALDNDGWHNSTTFPVENDNPLNGNMYQPLYFDGGQAIHGANNVPTTPQSKGCPRLRVEHHQQLVAWLGLDEVDGPVGGSVIDVTVNVQGEYVPR